MKTHEFYMNEALLEADKAEALLEVPIGAIIVYKDEIIGRGYNQRNSKKSTLAHAEILAIAEATSFMKDWRLEACTMYVTVEPCPMCAGAILQSRMTKLVIGTMNEKAGCVGSIYNLLDDSRFNHQVEVEVGTLGDRCSEKMSDFFRKLREVKKEEKARQKEVGS